MSIKCTDDTICDILYSIRDDINKGNIIGALDSTHKLYTMLIARSIKAEIGKVLGTNKELR